MDDESTNYSLKLLKVTAEYTVCSLINYGFKSLWNSQKVCNFIIIISNYHLLSLLIITLSADHIHITSQVQALVHLDQPRQKRIYVCTCVQRRRTSTLIFENVSF